jgi:two-component system phosphate regulon response regulator PhoB
LKHKEEQMASAENSHILVVDDERDLRAMVTAALEREGYRVSTAANGVEAQQRVSTERPDLIILDVMMPGMDGHQTCYWLKGDDELKDIPVIMLTARSEESDEVIGLGIGADDYVTKPFSPRVLAARVKALLRRSSAKSSAREEETIDCGEISIRPNRHQVIAGGREVGLTPIEFRILTILAQRPGWVFTRERIIDHAQGEDVVITERTVDVHIAALRKKLAAYADYIETVRGVGYKFRD